MDLGDDDRRSAGLPKVHSAMAGLDRNRVESGSMRDIKRGLLASERRVSFGDLRVPRVVRFDKTSVLADLPFVAQPGLTSRVATRTSLVSAAGEGSLSKTSSYLRLCDLAGVDDMARSLAPDEEQFVEEASGFTPMLRQTVAVALLSSFQYGFNNGNMNTQAGVQRRALGIAPGQGPDADTIWAFCVSIFCIGALAGCNVSGSLADSWGRRKFLLVSSAVYGLGALLEAGSAYAPADGCAATGGPCWLRVATLMLGRAVTGSACGGSTVVVPMYLGEVSPAHLRGMVGTAFQLTVVVAMLVAQVLGLPSALGTPALWPLVLGFVVLPAALQLALAGLLAESPRWLCLRGRVAEAQAALVQLRDVSPTDEALLEEMDVMLGAVDGMPQGDEGVGGSGGYKRRQAPLFGGRTRWPLTIAIVLMVVQQFSGINNAFNYSTVFLKANGMDDQTVQSIAILMNVGNVLITALSVYLMDRAGRRALLLTSMVCMALSTAALTVALTVALSNPGKVWTAALSVLSVVSFVSAFGIGLGPVPWLLPAEIMPAETRARASSLAASTNWLANFIVGQGFLLVARALGPFSFVPFAVCVLCGAAFAAKVLPETKGKSLEQIQAELQGLI